MKIKKIELETVCGVKSSFPDNELPEAAFAGRSNVGKSSLLNCIAERKALARTSSTPGKTQTINYYNLNDSIYLVDLPGYGYTKASLEVRAQWGQMVERYLNTTKSLKTIFLLLDIRHEPSKDDIQMYEWIVQKGIAPILVATKADKVKRSRYQAQIKLIRQTLGAGQEVPVIVFSALSKEGKEDLHLALERIIDKP